MTGKHLKSLFSIIKPFYFYRHRKFCMYNNSTAIYTIQQPWVWVEASQSGFPGLAWWEVYMRPMKYTRVQNQRSTDVLQDTVGEHCIHYVHSGWIIFWSLCFKKSLTVARSFTICAFSYMAHMGLLHTTKEARNQSNKFHFYTLC